MLNLVFVGVGGLLGSIGRYLLAGAVYQIFPNAFFPLGTAVVNILGCFLIGFTAGLAEVRSLFWQRTGWTYRQDISVISKNLEAD